MKQITYTATAAKELKAIAKPVRGRIIAKVKQYATDPESLANNVKRLQGVDALRLRVGDYRVIFTEDGVVLTVEAVTHRKDAYR